jgi:hypothetical protein
LNTLVKTPRWLIEDTLRDAERWLNWLKVTQAVAAMDAPKGKEPLTQPMSSRKL